jgi:pyrroloquinoline quinone biosynthesis protein B
MRILLLGTAAGGGVPQWNCNCPICREARLGKGRVRSRTQSCVAISADDKAWFLLNASPDIRAQIERTPALQPREKQLRGSPIEAVLLTNADLDHTLGLFLMREGKSLFVHSRPEVRQTLTEALSLTSVLGSFCRLEWVESPFEIAPLLTRDGERSGLLYQAIPLPGKAPKFARSAQSQDDEPSPSATSAALGHVVGYRIVDERTGGRLLFLPDVGFMNEDFRQSLTQCEALLFDGTFFTENEMLERGVGNQPASGMGHLPISGDDGSLAALAQLKLRHKIYVHINNTNPVLFEDSPERKAVTDAGCTVGEDGMEISI